MPRMPKTDEEKLVEDISYLNKDDWKKVRNYVTKLRQLERMDGKVDYALAKAGISITPKHNGIRCSFCGKAQSDVEKLIAGPGVFICDECIGLCNEIFEEEPLEDDSDDNKPSLDETDNEH